MLKQHGPMLSEASVVIGGTGLDFAETFVTFLFYVPRKGKKKLKPTNDLSHIGKMWVGEVLRYNI